MFQILKEKIIVEETLIHEIDTKNTDLAREALSTGDKILYENYMQHAEHFVRISANFTNGSEKKNGSSQETKDTNVSKIKQDELNQEDKI